MDKPLASTSSFTASAPLSKQRSILDVKPARCGKKWVWMEHLVRQDMGVEKRHAESEDLRRAETALVRWELGSETILLV